MYKSEGAIISQLYTYHGKLVDTNFVNTIPSHNALYSTGVDYNTVTCIHTCIYMHVICTYMCTEVYGSVHKEVACACGCELLLKGSSANQLLLSYHNTQHIHT